MISSTINLAANNIRRAPLLTLESQFRSKAVFPKRELTIERHLCINFDDQCLDAQEDTDAAILGEVGLSGQRGLGREAVRVFQCRYWIASCGALDILGLIQSSQSHQNFLWLLRDVRRLATMYWGIYSQTYIPTYIHTCIHTHIHPYIHACMHTCMHTYRYIFQPPSICDFFLGGNAACWQGWLGFHQRHHHKLPGGVFREHSPKAPGGFLHLDWRADRTLASHNQP